MSKKKDGKGKAPTTKNKNMIGGENTLPQNKVGKVDHKKIIKDGKKERQKPWTERIASKKVTPSAQSKPTSKTKGANKLKAAVTKTTPKKDAPNKTVTTPKKQITTKGISKFKAVAPKSKPNTAKPKTKKPPTKGR